MAVVVPDLPDLFEEAFERAGLEMQSGYDLRSIRRSFNLMMLEWQNRGINLFTIEAGTQVLTTGLAVYVMPVDTIDLLEASLRTGTGTTQADTNLEQIGVSAFAQLPNKNATGRPSQIYVQRNAGNVTVTLWPVPDSTATYTLSFYRLKGIDGVASGIGTTAAVPPRFVPALVAGLAYHIAMKKPEAATRVIPLKQVYEEQFDLVWRADDERVSEFALPPGFD